MHLRPDFTPPQLDPGLVARLADLADPIDGGRPGEWEDELAEFNHLANMNLEFNDFQRISDGEEHEIWVRRIPHWQRIKPVENVTAEEFVEIVRRALRKNRHPERDAYTAAFSSMPTWPCLTRRS